MNKTIKVFEPQMCCSSGVCGPSTDDKVVAFNDLIDKLKKDNYNVERYMLTRDINAFQSEAQVMAALKDEQLEALPITMIDEKIVKKGEYPTIEDIIRN